MQISSAKKAKIRAVFNSDFHPRYPAGHPEGGQFMPKGGEDYRAEVSKKKEVAHLTRMYIKGGGAVPRVIFRTLQSFLDHVDKNRADEKIRKKFGLEEYSSEDLRENANKSLLKNGYSINKKARDKIASKLAENKKLLESNKSLLTIFPKLIDRDTDVEDLPTIEPKKARVNGHTISVFLSEDSSPIPSQKTSDISRRRRWDSIGSLTMSLNVDNSFDKIEADDMTKIRIAAKARTLIRDAIKGLPDGTVISNSPHEGDGFGADRRRLYKAAGFSDDMHSVIVGGKFKPITLKEISILRGYNHVEK